MTNWLAAEALAPRTMPRQQRAVARRRAILDAAFALLNDHPVDVITTSLIAKRAGVPVASVYGYFPNKIAVIAELVRETVKEVDDALEEMMASRADEDIIVAAIDNSIDAIIEGYKSAPARQRLISAVRGNAILEPIMRASDDRMTASLATRLMKVHTDMLPLKAQAMAMTVVQTFTALQQGVVSCNNPPLSAALVAEWRTLIKSYMLPPQEAPALH